MELSVRELRVHTVCLLILSAIGIAAALYWLKPLMIPFVLALFCAFILTQLAEWLIRRAKFPRALALATSILLAILVFLLVATLIATSVRKLANNADLYQASTRRLLERLTTSLPLDEWGLAEAVDLESIYDLPVRNIGNMVLATTNAILDIVKRSLLVLIFVFFLLLGWRSTGNKPQGVWREIESRTKRFLVAKTAISAATGIMVWLILSFLGVDLALVFGLFAFMLNFIPSLGSIIATLLPLPLVIISPEATGATVVLAIVLPGALQISIGNVLEPKIMGDSLDMHPVAILLSLIFWGMLWGVVGMFLATPITAILKILLARHPYTLPLANLLAGKFKSVQFDALPYDIHVLDGNDPNPEPTKPEPFGSEAPPVRR